MAIWVSETNTLVERQTTRQRLVVSFWYALVLEGFVRLPSLGTRGWVIWSHLWSFIFLFFFFCFLHLWIARHVVALVATYFDNLCPIPIVIIKATLFPYVLYGSFPAPEGRYNKPINQRSIPCILLFHSHEKGPDWYTNILKCNFNSLLSKLFHYLYSIYCAWQEYMEEFCYGCALGALLRDEPQDLGEMSWHAPHL